MTKQLLRLARWLRAAAPVAVAVFAWTSVTYAQGTWTELAPNRGMAGGEPIIFSPWQTPHWLK